MIDGPFGGGRRCWAIYIAYEYVPETARSAVSAWQPLLGLATELLLNKYYVDELYDALFVNRCQGRGQRCGGSLMAVVDGGVNGAGWIDADRGRAIAIWWDTWVIDGAGQRAGLSA